MINVTHVFSSIIIFLVVLNTSPQRRMMITFHSLEGKLENEDVLNLTLYYSEDLTTSIEVFIEDSMSNTLYQAYVPLVISQKTSYSSYSRSWKYFDFKDLEVLKDSVDISGYTGALIFRVELFNELGISSETGEKRRLPIARNMLKLSLKEGKITSDLTADSAYLGLGFSGGARNYKIDGLEIDFAFLPSLYRDNFQKGDELKVYFRNREKDSIKDTLVITVMQRLGFNSVDTLSITEYPNYEVPIGISSFEDNDRSGEVNELKIFSEDKFNHPVEISYLFKNRGGILISKSGGSFLRQGEVRFNNNVNVFDDDEYELLEFNDSIMRFRLIEKDTIKN